MHCFTNPCVLDDIKILPPGVGPEGQPGVRDGVPPVPQAGEVREVAGPSLHRSLPASLHQPGRHQQPGAVWPPRLHLRGLQDLL